jgi:hypothetical protein
MAPKGKSQKQQRTISPEGPVWFDPSAPLGSAVRYVASLSPRIRWVGIAKGPSIGEHGRPRGRVTRIGRIQIETEGALDAAEQAAVGRVAKELEELWPA